MLDTSPDAITRYVAARTQADESALPPKLTARDPKKKTTKLTLRFDGPSVCAFAGLLMKLEQITGHRVSHTLALRRALEVLAGYYARIDNLSPAEKAKAIDEEREAIFRRAGAVVNG
jgi:hypothetical protein